MGSERQAVRQLAGRASLVLIGSGGAAVLSLVGQVLIARRLGAGVYGDYTYTLSWIAMLGLFTAVGIPAASMRFVAQYRATNETERLSVYRGWSLSVVTLCSAAVSLLVVVAVSLWPRPLADGLRSAILAGALLLTVNTVLQVVGSHLQGLGRAATSNAILGVVRGASFVLVVWLAVPGTIASAGGVLVANAVTAGIALLVVVLVSQRLFGSAPRFRGFRLAGEDGWLRTSQHLLLVGAAQVVLASTDTILLGLIRGTSESGPYVASSQLAGAIGVGVAALSSIVAPGIASHWAQGDRDGTRALVRRGRNLLLVFAVITAIVLAFAAPMLLGIFGKEFRGSVAVLRILLIGQVILSANFAAGFLLTMTGHERTASRLIAGMALLNLILNALLIPRFGAVGAATATMLAVSTRATLLARASKEVLAGRGEVLR
ncbi:MAG: oligosaccharide flippase family protein [Gemmatimonadota bacterium]